MTDYGDSPKRLIAFFVVVAALLFGAGARAAEPVAMVEDLAKAPKAKVELFDYVYPKQLINLGSKGKLVLSYLSSCRLETFAGGKVKVGESRSTVNGGRRKNSTREGCEAAVQVAAADASEAGAGVTRVTPFDDTEWQEITLKSSQPIFKWEKAGTAALSLLSLDAPDPVLVWQGTTDKTALAYPADAPALANGMPYGVRVEVAGQTLRAVFSVDPWMDMGNHAVDRRVPVTAAQ